MADSYRTNQWYDLGLDNSLVNRFTNLDSGYAVPRADNRDFKYPTRVSRTIDRSGNPVSTPLKRGYVRSLLSNTSRRCQFQFNPSSINQSVAQNTSILNFLQADPYQYAQPIPGNVTFNFGLFFDRTMEVANPQEAITSVIRTDNPWANNGPEHIGVLHDLSSLFSIIGVGVTEYMDRSLNDLEASPDDLAAGYFSDYITANAPTEATDSDDITATQYKDSLSELVNINRGNSAFLLPLPIRVVFSSLYIVEGLVNDIDIIFTKFSTQMVPIQCRVDISMESKYIGFAKDQTFFTHVLDDVKEKALLTGGSGFNASSDITGSNLELIRADLSKINLSVITENGSQLRNAISVGSEANAGFEYERQDSSREPGTRTKKRIRLELPDAKEGNDRLSSLFALGGSVSMKFDARVELHRFIDATTVRHVHEALNDAAQAEIADVLPTAQYAVWQAPNMSVLTDAISSAVSADPESYSLADIDPEDNINERQYNNKLKLWSLYLNDSNRYTDDNNYGVTSASILDEWKAILDRKSEGAMSESGQDDRSTIYDIGEGDLRTSAEEKHDNFSYFFLAAVSVEVKIDGETSSVTKAYCTKYRPTDVRNTLSGDYTPLTRVFNFDW
jgi:hypothetical protein